MSRNLILVITIFCFWLYIYLTNIKEENSKTQAERETPSLDDNSVGQGWRVNNTNKSYVISPVQAKGVV